MAFCKFDMILRERSSRFTNCWHTAVTEDGYCRTHDPKLKAARKAATPKCAHVDEDTGKSDCDTTVRGSKYCSWHADTVRNNRVHSQAQAQRTTLAWLESLMPYGSLCTWEVIERLKVHLRNP